MEEQRLKGNSHFAKGEYNEALAAYEYGITLATSHKYKEENYNNNNNKEEEEEKYWDILRKLHTNACSCLWAQHKYSECYQRAIISLTQCGNIPPAKLYGFIGMSLLKSTQFNKYWEAYKYIGRGMRMDSSLRSALLPYLNEATKELEKLQFGESKENNNNLNSDNVKQKIVEVRNSEVGFGVFAKVPIMKPGTRIEHEPAFSVGYHVFNNNNNNNNNNNILCINCAKYSGTQWCQECGIVAFCSNKCAINYHQRHINYECNALQLLSKLTDAIHDGLGLIMHIITTWSGYKSKVSGYKALERLARNTNISSDPALHHIISLILKEAPSKLIKEWAIAIKTNSFQRPDYHAQVLYVGGTHSYFNHSCEPNITISLETLHPINTREELCFDYPNNPFFLIYPTKLRREILQKDYLFYCHCPRCERGDTDPFEKLLCTTQPGYLLSENKLKELWERIHIMFMQNIPLASTNKYDALEAELKKYVMPYHYLMQMFRMGPQHPQCHLTVLKYSQKCKCSEEALPLPWLTMSHVELQKHGAKYRKPF